MSARAFSGPKAVVSIFSAVSGPPSTDQPLVLTSQPNSARMSFASGASMFLTFSISRETASISSGSEVGEDLGGLLGAEEEEELGGLAYARLGARLEEGSRLVAGGREGFAQGQRSWAWMPRLLGREGLSGGKDSSGGTMGLLGPLGP